MKDKKKKEDILKILDLNTIIDDDVYRDEKDLKGDDCEIDTRLSAINNILLNLSCAYMHLAHYEEALQCCNEILRLTNLSVEGYYRRSQIRTYNLKSTYADLELALQDIEKSIEKKPQEKKYLQHKEIIIKRYNLSDKKKSLMMMLNL